MKNLRLILFLLPINILGSYLTLEFRGGGFFTESDLIQKVYTNVGGEYEMESNLKLWDEFHLWANVNFFRHKGHSVERHNKSKIHIYPVSFGLKYVFFLTPDSSLYLGLGASDSFIKIDNNSTFTKQYIKKDKWGPVTKTGLFFYFAHCLILDIYADYYYTKAYVDEENKQNIGGLRVGAGLGICF